MEQTVRDTPTYPTAGTHHRGAEEEDDPQMSPASLGLNEPSRAESSNIFSDEELEDLPEPVFAVTTPTKVSPVSDLTGEYGSSDDLKAYAEVTCLEDYATKSAERFRGNYAGISTGRTAVREPLRLDRNRDGNLRGEEVETRDGENRRSDLNRKWGLVPLDLGNTDKVFLGKVIVTESALKFICYE